LPKPTWFIEKENSHDRSRNFTQKENAAYKGIAKLLVTLIYRGIDVKRILQNLTSSKQDIILDPKQKQSHC
jgi:hypothetical protein